MNKPELIAFIAGAVVALVLIEIFDLEGGNMNNVQNGAVIGADEQRAQEGLEAEERAKRIRAWTAYPIWSHIADSLDTHEVTFILEAYARYDHLSIQKLLHEKCEKWATHYVDSEKK